MWDRRYVEHPSRHNSVTGLVPFSVMHLFTLELGGTFNKPKYRQGYLTEWEGSVLLTSLY